MELSLSSILSYSIDNIRNQLSHLTLSLQSLSMRKIGWTVFTKIDDEVWEMAGKKLVSLR